MIVKKVIKAALRKLSAISSGQEPTPQEYADCLEAMNVMADGWSADLGAMYYWSREEFALTVGKNEYTIGTGADFDTARPKAIDSARIRYTSSDINDFPVKVVGLNRYEYQSLKSTLGRPTMLFYNPTYANGTIFLYYTPNEAYTLRLNMQKRLGEFTSINSDILLPEEYRRAFIYNLAVEVSDEFGFAVPNGVRRIADKSYKTLLKVNAANLLQDAELDPMLRQASRNLRTNRETING